MAKKKKAKVVSNSLQDQLLKAGMVDEKQLKQADKDKRKQEKVQRRSREQVVDETKQQAQQALADKAERDRQLNKDKQQLAEQKAIAAQIKQLIEVNRQSRGKGDSAYNFTDGKLIKKILVSDEVLNQLSRGRLALVRLGEGEEATYELVPAPVAEKIAQRDQQVVVALAEKPSSASEQEDEEDPYADYQIPDDLMW